MSCIVVDPFSWGKAFEQSIENGLIDVALDLSLVELVDFVNGGGEAESRLGQLTALFLTDRMGCI